MNPSMNTSPDIVSLLATMRVIAAGARKLLFLTFMFAVFLPTLAKDDEPKIKAAVEARYKEWIAAANN